MNYHQQSWRINSDSALFCPTDGPHPHKALRRLEQDGARNTECGIGVILAELYFLVEHLRQDALHHGRLRSGALEAIGVGEEAYLPV